MKQSEYQAIFLATIMQIPKGQVASYGQIAKLAGFPSFSRHVGRSLKGLPKDTKVPWHRVVNAQGKIAFDQDSIQYQTQKERLEREGIYFMNGKVSLSKYRWNPEDYYDFPNA